MAIGRSSCTYMCSINRTRLSSRNEAFLQVSGREFRLFEVLMHRNCVQTTCRTPSPMRIASISTIANIAAPTDDHHLKHFRRSSPWAWFLPRIARSARPFLTCVSSSQAAVAALQSQEHPEDASVKSVLSKTQRTNRRTKRNAAIKTYLELRRARAFKDHMEFSTVEDGSYTFHATLIISAGLVPPDARLTWRVEGRAPSKLDAERNAILLLRSRLEEALLWKQLIEKSSKTRRDRKDQEHELQSIQTWAHECGAPVEFDETGSPETGYICYSRVQFQALELSIEAKGEALTKVLARKDALLKLVAELKKKGLWPPLKPSQLGTPSDELPLHSETGTGTPLVPSSDDTAEHSTHPSAANKSYTLGPEEQELLQTFNRMRQAENLFRLDVDEYGMTPSFTCQVALYMLDRDASVEAKMLAPRKKTAKDMALLLLISKLQEAGLWEDLLQLTYFPPETTISVDNNLVYNTISLDDDLVYNLQLAKNELLQAEASLRKRLSQLERGPWNPRPGFTVTADYHEQRSGLLTDNLASFRHSQDPQAIAIRTNQATLPVSGFKESILENIRSSTYSLVVAETGSGKSTQVPQMILDDAIDQGIGGQCRVLCVQPRRLAAQLLSRRVAYERGEALGDSVGYSVRFDSRFPAKGGSITYCTTGIMLNYLKDEFHKSGSYTHILLDEVHVRDIGIDFVMLLLKRHVDHCRKNDLPQPKVIVMSATIDVDLFSSYFRNQGPDGILLPAPHISIPGRQYHVRWHFLSEVLEGLEASIRPGILSQLLSEENTKEFLRTQQLRFSYKDKTENAADDIDSALGVQPAKQASLEAPIDLENHVDGVIPYGLIAGLVYHLFKTTQTGAILVFLPGLQHILDTKKTLFEFDQKLGFDFADSGRFRILTLHSSLPEEQEELSKKFPEGCRRIILATDIAEASLTIPDVRYVIDGGRVNRLVYNNKLRSSRVDCGWISQSSASQRAGRAGRVHDGHYYFVGTNHLFHSLRVTASPEFLRGDLQTTSLVAKSIVPDLSISEALQQAPEPPDDEKILAAVDSLKWLKALDENENLTSVGRILNLLPLTPAFGKLVILGVIFRCLDPLLVIAAMGDERSIFRRGLNDDDHKKILLDRAKYAGHSTSDHLSAVNAFQAVRNEWRQGDPSSAHALAVSNNIHFKRYLQVFNMSRHIFENLVQERLVFPLPGPFAREDTLCGPELNTNSHNVPLIKALLLHCLTPQIAAARKGKNPGRKYCTQTDEVATFPRSSLSLNLQNLPLALALYSSKAEGYNEMRLRDVSLISPLAACVFGGKLEWQDEELIVNSWLNMGMNLKNTTSSKDEVAAEMIQFSSALDKALTATWDSLDVERQFSFKRQLSPRLCKTRQHMDATLQKAVMEVFNRDLYRIGDSTTPTVWEVPMAQGSLGTTQESVQ